jgi:DNA-binding beta-propeller fold protein YncE
MKSAVLITLTAALLCSQTPSALRPGPLSDGSELLPSGWRIQPAGMQIKAGSFPLTSALSPDGKFLAVVNAGSPASVTVFNSTTMAEASRIAAPGAWQGIVFSQDGRTLYVGGGAENVILELAVSGNGSLKLSRQMPGAAAGGFISDIAIPPMSRLIYAADLLHNEILVFDPQVGRVSNRYKSGRRPYQLLFHPDGKSYFVSSWADASVYQYRATTGEEIGRMRLAPHPTAMVLSDRRIPEEPNAPPVRIFIATTSSNNVFTIGVDRNDLMSQGDVLNVGFSPNLPAGMTPSALALSKDKTQLFVACSNVNAIAVADVSELRSHLAGFIPVGAYPSSTRPLNDGRIAVTNAHSDSLTVVPQFSDAELATMTDQALALIPLNQSEPAPRPLPVENAILVTLDWKDRGVNFAKLAKEFAAVDNFYPNAPDAEGIEWALSGLPSDFAQRMRGRTFSATDPANQPPAGTLLSNARQAGLTTGEFGPTMPQELPLELPRFTLIRLAGASADRSLGQVVATLSKSPLWTKTAVFVIADRAPLLVISPYSHRAPVANGMFYNHSSVLRTLELIFKLRPLTVFDASARPLSDLFSATADAAPFIAETR